jgi:hypothetical protein
MVATWVARFAGETCKGKMRKSGRPVLTDTPDVPDIATSTGLSSRDLNVPFAPFAPMLCIGAISLAGRTASESRRGAGRHDAHRAVSFAAVHRIHESSIGVT